MNRRAILSTAIRGAAAAAVAATSIGIGHLPRAYASPQTECEPRYLGYAPEDYTKDYARYFTTRTDPVQDNIRLAIGAPPVSPQSVPSFASLTDDLSPTGYSDIETGYGSPDGIVVWAAALTHMPRVTAAMWDWWFGWHSGEPARYKLWHPDAHAFASISRNLADAPGLTDRARYVGNISYVDEFIGHKLEQLAISFMDPVAAGSSVPDGHTVIYGRVGTSVLPVDLGWLAHQIRPVEGGSEMRSRFYLNMPGLRALDLHQAQCALERGSTVATTDSILDVPFGRDLMQHCGAEMNHLSRFLPELHAEFS